MGKGSARRPAQVPRDVYEANYERTFECGEWADAMPYPFSEAPRSSRGKCGRGRVVSLDPFTIEVVSDDAPDG